MSSAALLGLTVLAVTVAAGICTSPRVGWVKARQARRDEYRIVRGPGLYLDPPLVTCGLPRDGRPLDDCEKRILGRISMDALIDIPEPAYDHRRQA